MNTTQASSSLQIESASAKASQTKTEPVHLPNAHHHSLALASAQYYFPVFQRDG
jgi:hypothetical protein